MDVSLPTIDRWIKDSGTAFVEQFGGNGRAYQIDARKLRAWREGRILEEKHAEERRQQQLSQMELTFSGGAAPAGEGVALTVDHRKKLIEEQLALLKLQQQRGELVEISRVELAHETRMKLVADFLRGLPDNLARKLAWDVEATKACAEAIEGMQEILARSLMETQFLD
jgi:hypothetical protein